MVEQLTLNQRVGGSSPPRFTIRSHGLTQLDCRPGQRLQFLTRSSSSPSNHASDIDCFGSARQIQFLRRNLKPCVVLVRQKDQTGAARQWRVTKSFEKLYLDEE